MPNVVSSESASRKPAVRILGAAIALLSLATVSAQAQDPVLTLAMARSTQSHDSHAARPHSLSIRAPRTTPASAPEKAVLPRTSIETASALNLRLTREPEPTPENPLLLSQRNLREYGNYKVGATVQAGFGKVFYDRPAMVYGRNGAGFEEPSCGYLKVNFTF